jgi:hypothetical protein
LSFAIIADNNKDYYDEQKRAALSRIATNATFFLTSTLFRRLFYNNLQKQHIINFASPIWVTHCRNQERTPNIGVQVE